MKKLVFLMITSILISSCSVSKYVRTADKTIKGDWILNRISYSDSGDFTVMLFDDASKECFENSFWHFIPNNHTGTYEIKNSQCQGDKRYFSFSFQEVNPDKGLIDFLLKPTDKKKKSKDNKGYRMHLRNLSATDMQWDQSLTVDGKPFVIHLNFSRVEK